MNFIDEFTKSYVECLEWVKEEDNISLKSTDFEEIERDCRIFQVRARKYMKDLDPRQCGHDFYLTRNSHGSGFLDRGYDKQVAVMLCKISKEFGESGEGTE